MTKTKNTKINRAWIKACGYPITRKSPCGTYTGEIDRGVNFFVLMLEQIGAVPEYSCEGHPDGFYVLFWAPYEIVEQLWTAGYFRIEFEGDHRWSIRTDFSTELEKGMVLSAAAESWEEKFGPLTYSPRRRKRRRAGTKR